MPSPLLALPGAVAGDGIDAPVAAHYGSFNTEQRALAHGDGFADLSHRDVLRVAGPERLSWLHNLTTQYFDGLAPGTWTQALVLSPQGHVEHAFAGVDDGEAFTAHTEPGAGPALVEWLERMKFMTRAEVSLVDDLAAMWRPGDGAGRYDLVPRDLLEAYCRRCRPGCRSLGLRGAADRARRGPLRPRHRPPHHPQRGRLDRPGRAPRQGLLPGPGDRGPVHTLGRPPRRLVLLHLDGSENRLPPVGSPVSHEGRDIGFVGSSARHHELGPIALALVKRNVPVDAVLTVDEMPAAQEVVVDPEVGLHVRPLR